MTRNDRRGFSLTELVVVLAVLMLLVAAILPVIGPMRKRGRLRSSVRSVVGTLRATRSLAIAQSALYSMEIRLPVDAECWEMRVLTTNTVETLSNEVTVETPASGSTITFLPDGSCSSTCTSVVLRLKEKEPGKDRFRIRLSKASGRISVARMKDVP